MVIIKYVVSMKAKSQLHHRTKLEAFRVNSQLERGQTHVKVAETAGVSQNVIYWFWKRILETGNADRRPRRDRSCATTFNYDR
ncbi:hypothetical protein TNCV_2923791 [Trichonephila clavipes]|nr:hypothetical protein TNCV_2923791 [Trichonephila clavipes]